MAFKIYTGSADGDTFLRLKDDGYGVELQVVDREGDFMYTILNISEDGALELWNMEDVNAEDEGFDISDEYITVIKN